MTEQYRDYYERRAREERLAGENAVDGRAAQTHRELAARYQRVASGEEVPERDNGQRIVLATAQSDFWVVP